MLKEVTLNLLQGIQHYTDKDDQGCTAKELREVRGDIKETCESRLDLS